MISFGVSDKSLANLEGKHIFHYEKDRVAFAYFQIELHNNIGRYLGQVTEVRTPFRIYYRTNNGETGYVAASDIGYCCDTLEEALSLEVIRTQAGEKMQTAQREIAEWLNQQITELHNE